MKRCAPADLGSAFSLSAPGEASRAEGRRNQTRAAQSTDMIVAAYPRRTLARSASRPGDQPRRERLLPGATLEAVPDPSQTLTSQILKTVIQSVSIFVKPRLAIRWRKTERMCRAP